MNGLTSAAISSAFRDLYGFGREQGPVPVLVGFWHETFSHERRVLLCGPVGARVEAVFAALTGVALDEDRLRRRICEARPEPAAGKELEGIDRLAGRSFAGAFVSAALHGTAGREPESLKLTDWLDRVALVVVVSPAPAVLGKLEIELMERRVREGGGFCVVVTRLEGACEEERAEFRAEIAEHKVEPLRKELGPFEVFYTAGEETSSLRAELEPWVRSRLEESHFEQLRRIVARWAAELKQGLETRAAEERKIQARLDFLTGHLEDQVARLRDLVSQERMAVENRILEAVGIVEEACGEAPHTGRLDRVWITWDGLAALLASAPSELVERVRKRFAGQIREFCEAYRGLLTLEFEAGDDLGSWKAEPLSSIPDAVALRRQVERKIDQPDNGFFLEIERRARREAEDRLAELASEQGRQLEAESETVLRKLDRYVQAQIQTKRASLRVAGLLGRLDELAGRWDRVTTEAGRSLSL